MVVLTLNVNPLPISSLASIYLILPGDTAILDAGAGFSNYLWNTGATTQILEAVVPGIYEVEITDNNSCASTASTEVELTLNTIHNVTIDEYWSFFSTYVDPLNDSIQHIFAPVINDILLVKNSSGQSFWPYFGLNLIGEYIIGEGYQVKSLNTVVCPIAGEILLPEQTPINIPIGWSLIGYLRMNPGDATTMMSSVYSNILLMKDKQGFALWPYFNMNQIGDMNPGEGYQIKMMASDILTYPVNSVISKSTNSFVPEVKHFSESQKTNSNMTIGIPLSAWETLPEYGDEIAVISASGNIIGSSVFTNNHLAISVWGDDVVTETKENINDGESFNLVIWNKQNNEESNLNIERWTDGDNQFSENKISIVGKIQSETSTIPETLSSSYYPNPFADVVNITFTIPEQGLVKIDLLDNNGKVIDIICSKNFVSGTHNIEYKNSNISQGVYFYKVICKDKSIVKKIIKK